MRSRKTFRRGFPPPSIPFYHLTEYINRINMMHSFTLHTWFYYIGKENHVLLSEIWKYWIERKSLNFWPRAPLKGPKRSFVVLVLSMETQVKNVPNWTKIVQENKKCASVIRLIQARCLEHIPKAGNLELGLIRCYCRPNKEPYFAYPIPRKKLNLPYFIFMYRTNFFWQPTVHVCNAEMKGRKWFEIMEIPSNICPLRDAPLSCALSVSAIWTQKVPKEAWRCELPTSIRVFSKTFCCTWTVGCQKFVQYIRYVWSKVQKVTIKHI